MEHPFLLDRNRSIEWARNILNNKDNYLILDTETTGLGEKDVVIQVGLIDLNGNVLIDTLVKTEPQKSISRDATDLHGIRAKDLRNAPRFGDALLDFMQFANGKFILIYNFEFDTRLINQTFWHEDLSGTFEIKGDCIMRAYSQFVGAWNPFYNDYKRQRLIGGTHSAVGDCLAALKVIEKMASEELVEIPEDYAPNIPNLIAPNTQSKAPDSKLDGSCIFLIVFFCIVFIFLLAILNC